MGLRHILMVLSLLAFLSALAGGALYYASLRQAAEKEAVRQAAANTELIQKSLNSFLAEHQKPASTLASIPALQRALIGKSSQSIYEANVVLDRFKTTLDADVCYLLNQKGTTIASSNRMDPDSFVGRNFSFRPYFKQAVSGVAGAYLALGTASLKRGVYHSYPVFDDPDAPPVGIAVIKSSIEKTEKRLGLPKEDIVLVTDPNGIVFISSRSEWLYHSIWKLSSERIAKIAAERQFGKGPWLWIGLRRVNSDHVLDAVGNRYLVHQTDVENFAGWRIYHFRDLTRISKMVSAPLLKIVGPVIVLLTVMISIAVLVLYKKASREIFRRRSAEQALRQSENRYRSLYHHTPAMLHSIDPQGNLLSVSDYWVEHMGYSRDEVIGKPLTGFLTDASRKYARQEIFPRFFETGFCKDVSYQFITKTGRVIDVLLSGIADRDDSGAIQRSLAVSIDVTERKRAEEALRIAKEELGLYTKELENQVAKRTSEITSILKYTPAVVYMKDAQGNYLLVNSRFEELFDVRSEDVRGKSDVDLLPDAVAVQFRTNDELVLSKGYSLHVEEQIPQSDGVHTYLSVKFPIYGETGNIRGVCGIASDITAVKEAHEQVRRLSGSIMANQEKERAAIARELHDELGQVLTALRLDAVWVQEQFKKAGLGGVGRATAMCSLIDSTIEDVRSLAIRLRPGVLDDLGLVDALEWYTGEFERRSQIPCVFTYSDFPVIDETLATAAYRIAQEALTNVARHAGAGQVKVHLELDRGHLVLSVSDDGCGFQVHAISENKALGLAGMRERAVLVGGTLTVDSSPGQGVRVCFRARLYAPSGTS
jgi:PAS domain S-box-containing protein